MNGEFREKHFVEMVIPYMPASQAHNNNFKKEILPHELCVFFFSFYALREEKKTSCPGHSEITEPKLSSK